MVCFNCGGDHFARRCPEGGRRGKGQGKGKVVGEPRPPSTPPPTWAWGPQPPTVPPPMQQQERVLTPPMPKFGGYLRQGSEIPPPPWSDTSSESENTTPPMPDVRPESETPTPPLPEFPPEAGTAMCVEEILRWEADNTNYNPEKTFWDSRDEFDISSPPPPGYHSESSEIDYNPETTWDSRPEFDIPSPPPPGYHSEPEIPTPPRADFSPEPNRRRFLRRRLLE